MWIKGHFSPFLYFKKIFNYLIRDTYIWVLKLEYLSSNPDSTTAVTSDKILNLSLSASQ